MSDAAKAFVENWSNVWDGPDSDPELYMSLLHEGCPLINPLNEIKREDLLSFMAAVLQTEPDIRVRDRGRHAVRAIRRGPLHPAGRQGDRGLRVLRPAPVHRAAGGKRLTSAQQCSCGWVRAQITTSVLGCAANARPPKLPVTSTTRPPRNWLGMSPA